MPKAFYVIGIFTRPLQVGEELEALSLSEVGTSTNGLTKLI